MLIKEFTLRPIGGEANENVLIEENGYPWALIFVDMFHTPRDAQNQGNDVYNAIYNGEPFRVKMTLEIINE